MAKEAAKGRPERCAEIHRKTGETDVFVSLVLDGAPTYAVDTGIPFLDHMLELFAKHGGFGLEIRAQGDLEVDFHHTVEDVGLTLGQALKQALGEKAGIQRFGEATVPLDEALVSVVVDLSGRPFLVYEAAPAQDKIGDFDVELIHDFFLALSNEAGMNLHIRKLSGRNPHHVIEAGFKGFARALAGAVSPNPRVRGVPSTKGVL